MLFSLASSNSLVIGVCKLSADLQDVLCARRVWRRKSYSQIPLPCAPCHGRHSVLEGSGDVTPQSISRYQAINSMYILRWQQSEEHALASGQSLSQRKRRRSAMSSYEPLEATAGGQVLQKLADEGN